jgi:glyoxylase-like metal-dependent hydrolase (beta-lactamase superfamily II)
MTLQGTNTYVVQGYVIDPGPDDAEHLERVREAAGGQIAGVLLTHGHSDHSAGVEALGAEVLWGRATRESEMEAMRRALEGGSIEPSDEKPSHSDENSSVPPEIGPFTVVATPGHAGGSLADYMRSLDTVAALDLELLAPGHGPWITDPAAKIAEYREHRLDRERRLIEALGRGERSRAALLAEVWDDVPEQLRPAAAIAMQSHCEKLEAEGRLDRAELID